MDQQTRLRRPIADHGAAPPQPDRDRSLIFAGEPRETGEASNSLTAQAARFGAAQPVNERQITRIALKFGFGPFWLLVPCKFRPVQLGLGWSRPCGFRLGRSGGDLSRSF
jgi:hypothetical protein